MKKVDITKLLKEDNNPYADKLDMQIEKVESLVDKKVISPKFARALISYLTRKEIAHLVTKSINTLVHSPQRKEKWFVMNYNKKRTSYL